MAGQLPPYFFAATLHGVPRLAATPAFRPLLYRSALGDCHLTRLQPELLKRRLCRDCGHVGAWLIMTQSVNFDVRSGATTARIMIDWQRHETSRDAVRQMISENVLR